MDDLDRLLEDINRGPSSVLPVASQDTKNLQASGFTSIPAQWGSNYRLWESDQPWVGTTQPSRAVQIDNMSSNSDPVAVLSAEFSMKLVQESDSVRLWQEPVPRSLQQCIMTLKSDKVERSRYVRKALIWVPVLNHRVNGQVKGVVVHRQMSGLQNLMEPCDLKMALQLRNPKGHLYREIEIQPKSLLTVFTFDLGADARTGTRPARTCNFVVPWCRHASCNIISLLVDQKLGTWILLLTESGGVYDTTEIEVLSFSKPDMMLVDLSSRAQVPVGTATDLRVQARYFFDEPVRAGKVSYSINPSDPSVPPFKSIDPNWKSKDGIISFAGLSSKLGSYGWEVTIIDADGRTGSITGMYSVVNPAFSFECGFSVQSSTTVAANTTEKYSTIYPGSSTVAIDLAVKDFKGEAVPDCPFSLEMEGRDEFWRFTCLVPPDTGATGRVRVQLAFNEQCFESAEPFVMLVSAVNKVTGERFVWRKVILVDPRNQYSLKFDKKGYKPGENVTVTVRLQRSSKLMTPTDQTLAVEVVGQTVWHSSTLRFLASDAKSEQQYSFTAPETRDLLHIHLRPTLSVSAARFRVPIEVSSFYTAALDVESPAKVATSEAIAVKITLPQPAESDGVAVAIIVDKRIKKHSDCDNTQRWENAFKVDPVTKTESYWPFYSVTEWEHTKAATRFQAMLCSVQWIGWAFLNPVQQGRVLLVSLKDTSVLTPARVHFLQTLLSPAKSTYDSVRMVQHITGAEEAAIFTVGSSVKTLSKGDQWHSPANQCSTPLRSLRKALKGQLSHLTNNLITTPHKDPNRLRRKKATGLMMNAVDKLEKLRDALDNLSRAAGAESDYYYPTVVRQNFIEVATSSVAFRKGDSTVEISFPGSDAITTYDVYAFACNDGQIAFGKSKTVVKNKYFTVTKNPAQMVMADLTFLRTIVQNVSDVPMEDVALQLTLDKLRCKTAEQRIALVEPGASASVIWEILADKVGEAKMELVMRAASGFTEISAFDTPLTVVPPGEPVVQRTNGLVDNLGAFSMKFKANPKAAYVKIVASILPCIPVSGAVHGVESLSKYPYGCCEQTHSATLPNLILYRYLRSSGSTNEELKAKCLKNLGVGCCSLIDKYRCTDGGFGSWNRVNSTSFHTGLILSLLALSADIDAAVITGAKACLAKRMKSDGSFPPESIYRHWPESQFDVISSTAHTFNNLCLAGHLIPETLVWLKSNLLNRPEDSTAMALVLEGLTRLPAEERIKFTVFMRNLRKLLLLEQRLDGSWQETSGTSLSGTIETTAYAVIALGRSIQLEKSGDLAKATHDTTAAIAKGLQYVISKQQGSTGWHSTRDTLYAAWAVAETLAVLRGLIYLQAEVVWPKGANSTYTVKLNGREVNKFTLQMKDGADQAAINTIFKMREFIVPADNLPVTPPEDNELTVSSSGGNANSSVSVEISSYFFADGIPIPVRCAHQRVDVDAATALEQSANSKPVASLGCLTANFTSGAVFQRGRTANLAVRLNLNDEYSALMLEIPVPAGMLLPSIDSVVVNSRSESGVTKEFNTQLKVISVFFHKVSSGEPISVDVKLEPFIVGTVTANPCRAYLMYAPDSISVSPSTPIRITAEDGHEAPSA